LGTAIFHEALGSDGFCMWMKPSCSSSGERALSRSRALTLLSMFQP
jgi:hypothetical protein